MVDGVRDIRVSVLYTSTTIWTALSSNHRAKSIIDKTGGILVVTEECLEWSRPGKASEICKFKEEYGFRLLLMMLTDLEL